MRLSAVERTAIKSAATEVFGRAAEVRLFGSRADDRSRGGDIDLYVEVDQPVTLKDEARFQKRICDSIGDQKVDVVVHVRGTEKSLIEEEASETGVPL